MKSALDISRELLEQDRAAIARGESAHDLALAHLRACMTLLALVNPAASRVLSRAINHASAAFEGDPLAIECSPS